MSASRLEFWQKNGYIIIENAVSEQAIISYINFWNSHHSKHGSDVNYDGWNYFTSYLDHKEILDILCSEEPFKAISEIAGDGFGIHLAFTYFKSRERGWHRDVMYENAENGDNYLALWIALEDISLECGPVELIPGSHKWNINQEHNQHNVGHVPEYALMFQQAVESVGARSSVMLVPKGTAIIWHGHLIHRVIPATNNELSRKVVIAHLIKNVGTDDAPTAISHNYGYFYNLTEDREKTYETNFSHSVSNN